MALLLRGLATMQSSKIVPSDVLPSMRRRPLVDGEAAGGEHVTEPEVEAVGTAVYTMPHLNVFVTVMVDVELQYVEVTVLMMVLVTCFV